MRADGVETFRLLLIGTGEREQLEQLQAWADSAALAWLGDTNVTVDAVSPRSDDVQRAMAKLAPTAANSPPPAALLVSPQGDVARVDGGLAPPQLTKEAVMDILARVADSPVREKMLEQLTRAWCVVLLVAGDDPQANQRAREAVWAAAKRIEGSATEMDKIVTVAPVLIEVPADGPNEAVLRWSAGLSEGPSIVTATQSDTEQNDAAQGGDAVPDESTGNGAMGRVPRVAMVTGRAQQRGPILVGSQITADRLFEMFEMLGRSCTCTTDAIWTTGRTLPIRWTREMDLEAQIELGFDPNDPEAIDLLRNSVRGSGGGLGGYQEITFDAIAASAMTVPDEPLAASSDAAQRGEARSPAAGSNAGGPVGQDGRANGTNTAGGGAGGKVASNAESGTSKTAEMALAAEQNKNEGIGARSDNASEAAATDAANEANEAGEAHTASRRNAEPAVPWSLLGAVLLGAVVFLMMATLLALRR